MPWGYPDRSNIKLQKSPLFCFLFFVQWVMKLQNKLCLFCMKIEGRCRKSTWWNRLWFCGNIDTYPSPLSFQPASVMATAHVWMAACVSSAVTLPLALTVRRACLVTMETQPMVANARVSVAWLETLVILHTLPLMDLPVVASGDLVKWTDEV